MLNFAQDNTVVLTTKSVDGDVQVHAHLAQTGEELGEIARFTAAGTLIRMSLTQAAVDAGFVRATNGGIQVDNPST